MARLIADIGGTNVRFALVDAAGRPVDERLVATADFPGPVEAALAFLAGRPADEAVMAVATPVEEDEVKLTNSPWRFSLRATKAALGLRRLAVINDFVAQALAVPCLGPGDLVKLGGGEPVPGRPIAVIGPGTGLGVSLLLPLGRSWLAVPSEGGHVSFAPGDELEAVLLAALRKRFGHVSNERLLSGPGLLDLARTLAAIEGTPIALERPEEVSARALDGSCAICVRAVRRFVAILGSAAGDLALTCGARGGVYVTGGICKRLGPLLDPAVFRERFVAKGRLGAFLSPIPTFLAMRSGMGLLGAAAYDLDMGEVP